jgi:hypothetical protein
VFAFISTFFSVASKGIGANLLKVGSKRRRTQAEISNQCADDAMHDIMKEEHQSQIALLTNQLSKAKEQAESNKAAAYIFNQMIS